VRLVAPGLASGQPGGAKKNNRKMRGATRSRDDASEISDVMDRTDISIKLTTLERAMRISGETPVLHRRALQAKLRLDRRGNLPRQLCRFRLRSVTSPEHKSPGPSGMT